MFYGTSYHLLEEEEVIVLMMYQKKEKQYYKENAHPHHQHLVQVQVHQVQDIQIIFYLFKVLLKVFLLHALLVFVLPHLLVFIQVLEIVLDQARY